MAELRSAIVGCGGIAQVHARALSEMPEAELIAFADVIPERAEAMAEKYGGRAYSSLDELLDHEKIDVLHICTPHYLHTPMAQAAAERGINVFTEKPPVIDRQQWTEFKQLGDKVRVGICFQNRYNGSTRALKDLLSTGEPGKVLGSRGFVTWRRDGTGTGVCNGNYYDNDYAGAKLDFACRAGLVQEHRQFTDEQLTEMYRCIHETLDSEYPITGERRKALATAAEQIQRAVEDLDERVELSNQLELEAVDGASPEWGMSP